MRLCVVACLIVLCASTARSASVYSSVRTCQHSASPAACTHIFVQITLDLANITADSDHHITLDAGTILKDGSGGAWSPTRDINIEVQIRDMHLTYPLRYRLQCRNAYETETYIEAARYAHYNSTADMKVCLQSGGIAVRELRFNTTDFELFEIGAGTLAYTLEARGSQAPGQRHDLAPSAARVSVRRNFQRYGQYLLVAQPGSASGFIMPGRLFGPGLHRVGVTPEIWARAASCGDSVGSACVVDGSPPWDQFGKWRGVTMQSLNAAGCVWSAAQSSLDPALASGTVQALTCPGYDASLVVSLELDASLFKIIEAATQWDEASGSSVAPAPSEMRASVYAEDDSLYQDTPDCGAHGYVDPALNTTCICDSGWQSDLDQSMFDFDWCTLAAVSEPGGANNGTSSNATTLDEAPSTDTLFGISVRTLIYAAAAAAGVLVCALCGCCMWRCCCRQGGSKRGESNAGEDAMAEAIKVMMLFQDMSGGARGGRDGGASLPRPAHASHHREPRLHSWWDYDAPPHAYPPQMTPARTTHTLDPRGPYNHADRPLTPPPAYSTIYSHHGYEENAHADRALYDTSEFVPRSNEQALTPKGSRRATGNRRQNRKSKKGGGMLALVK